MMRLSIDGQFQGILTARKAKAASLLTPAFY
jgi:hypothetical protein